MNLENAKRAIAVMERVKTYSPFAFDMTMWFKDYNFTAPIPVSEDQALECGTAACFLGWLALAPEIPEIFVSPDDWDLIQHINGSEYAFALSHFLEISSTEAYALCGIHLTYEEERKANFPKYLDYGIPTPQDVIDLLNYLIDRYSPLETTQ